MSNLRRFYQPGQAYFLTCVTQNRIPILVENIELVRAAIEYSRGLLRWDLIAWTIMPDHLHLLVQPDGDCLSQLVKRFKEKFTSQYRAHFQARRGKYWQNRFWDHMIRNQEDHNRHLDYIHYNCVKHGCCANPFEYKWSSASLFLQQGYYSPDWGTREVLEFEGDFGE